MDSNKKSYYDTTEPQSVASVTEMIKVAQAPDKTPGMVWFIIPKDEISSDGVPNLNLEIKRFVNIDVLPRALRDLVKDFLHNNPDVASLDPEAE